MIGPLFGTLNPLAAASRRPFSAMSVAGLALWLRADQGAYQDTGKTEPCTNGAYIETWADQSGNGYDAVQATPTYEAGWATQQVNGLPAAQFGGGQYYTSPVTTIANPTYFVVFSSVRSQADILSGLDYANGNVPCRFGLQYLQYDDIGMLAGGPGLSAYQSQPSGWIITSALFDGPNSTLRRNGTTIFADDAGSDPMSGGLVIGIGASLNGYAFAGAIAEILIYDRPLQITEQQTVERYLNRKYDIY